MDVIDLTNTSVTSAVLNGSTLTVTEAGGSQSTYQVAGSLTGNYFAIQSDGGNGDELVVTPVSSSVAVSVFGNDEVQAGQILVAQASITGDATDQAASVTYQWEFSSNGGQTWSAPVASTTTGMVNGELSGLYQLTQAETGDLVRAVAMFTDSTGQVQITTSTQTAAIAETRRIPACRSVTPWTIFRSAKR